MGSEDPRGFQRRPQTKPRVSRTRTGCWTCRDRSVKCDEQQPRCGKCQKSDLSCEWGIRLQWIEDSDAKGICHGREGVWSHAQSNSSQEARRRHRARYSQPVPSHDSHTPDFNDTIFFLNTFAKDVQQYLLQDSSVHDTDDQVFDSPHVARSERRDALSAEVGQDAYASVPRAPNCTGLSRPMAESDSYILNYFNHVVCSSTALFDDAVHNPFRYLIVPMAATSHIIFHALLAVGAAKLAFRDSRYRHSALLYHHRLLTDLKASLGNLDSGLTQPAEVLAGTLMLCWHDISDFCRPSWTNHLSGLCALLQDYSSTHLLTSHDQRLVEFCRQYLVYHMIMAKATFRLDALMPHAPSLLPTLLRGMRGEKSKPKDPTSGISQSGWGGATDERLWGNQCKDDDIEPHQGFSNSLLFLINDICDLADTRHSSSPHQQRAIQAKASFIERSLRSLDQKLPSSFPFSSSASHHSIDLTNTPESNDLDMKRLQVIRSTAEANRLATLLFLDQTCRLNFPDIKVDMTINSPPPESCGPRKKDNSAKTIIDSILSLSESICDSGLPITAALPIWPAFMAGCVLNTERDRLRLLKIFDRFQEQKRYGSVPPACAVLETIWRQRDLKSDENPRRPPPPPPSLPIHNNKDNDSRRIHQQGQKKKEDKIHTPPQQQQPIIPKPRRRYPWEEAMLMSKGMILSLT